MASESSEEETVSLALSTDSREWLEEKAATLGVPPDELLDQLLASYRTAASLDDDELAADALFDAPDTWERDTLEATVRDIIQARIPDIAGAVETELDDDATTDVTAVQQSREAELDQLSTAIDSLDAEFQQKIDDVRDRVVQVKREADAKAPADHSHPELDEIDALQSRLDGLTEHVDAVESSVDDHDETLGQLQSRLDDLEAMDQRLEDVEDKLDTIAWVVSDLREAHEAQRTGSRAIDRLKRQAAEKDIDRAVCDSCENTVDVALLSEPKCPHCQATVDDVRLPGGLFGKPRLSVAKRLESGSDEGDDDTNANVPGAAKR